MWRKERGRHSPTFVFAHRAALSHWHATSLQLETPADTQLSQHLRAERKPFFECQRLMLDHGSLFLGFREHSRFVVFAILALRCTDCSPAVFFSRLKTSSTRTVTSRFFLVGHGTGTQFRVLPRRGRRSRDPTLFLRDFQDGCIDKLKIDF